MATREENLKKIRSELQKLSDEELDQVAGGTIGETAGDSNILYDHGLMDTWYSIVGLSFAWCSKSAAVDAGWAKAGITCCTVYVTGSGANKYWKDGKEISRDEAIKYVKANFKRIHNVSSD